MKDSVQGGDGRVVRGGIGGMPRSVAELGIGSMGRGGIGGGRVGVNQDGWEVGIGRYRAGEGREVDSGWPGRQ